MLWPLCWGVSLVFLHNKQAIIVFLTVYNWIYSSKPGSCLLRSTMKFAQLLEMEKEILVSPCMSNTEAFCCRPGICVPQHTPSTDIHVEPDHQHHSIWSCGPWRGTWVMSEESSWEGCMSLQKRPQEAPSPICHMRPERSGMSRRQEGDPLWTSALQALWSWASSLQHCEESVCKPPSPWCVCHSS